MPEKTTEQVTFFQTEPLYPWGRAMVLVEVSPLYGQESGASRDHYVAWLQPEQPPLTQIVNYHFPLSIDSATRVTAELAENTMNSKRWEHLLDLSHPTLLEAYKLERSAAMSSEFFQAWLMRHISHPDIEALHDDAHTHSLQDVLFQAARLKAILLRTGR